MSKHYDFKQAIRVGRTTFPLGIRQVPAEIEAHPHFKQFLKDGAVKVAGALLKPLSAAKLLQQRLKEDKRKRAK
jgi:hypothetical protein